MARRGSSSTTPTHTLSSQVYSKAKKIDSHIDRVTESIRLVAFSKHVPPRVLLAKRIMSSFIILVLVSYSFSPYVLKANTVLFYSTTCLGGWVTPEQAVGKPAEEGELLSAENSAVLLPNTHAEIYCGSFDGDVPVGTVPQNTKLVIHWETHFKDEAVQHSNDDADNTETTETATSTTITSDNFASSTQHILDAQGDTVTFTSTTTEENVEDPVTGTETDTENKPTEDASSGVAGIIDSIIETFTPNSQVDQAPVPEVPVTTQDDVPTPQEVTPVQEESPTSFNTIMGWFIDTAYAEDEPVLSSEPVIEEVSAQEPVIIEAPSEVTSETVVAETPREEQEPRIAEGEAPAEPEIQVVPTPEDVPPGYVPNNDDGVIPLEPIIVPVVDVTPPTSPFVEVLYTFDGVTWTSLAKLAPDQISQEPLIVPYEPGTTWKNLKSLQVKIQSLQTFDETPTVFVDAIEFQIEHKRKYDTRVDAHQELTPIDIDKETGQKVLLFGDETLRRIKGITSNVALVDISRANGEDDLWLYDLENDQKFVIATGTQIASDFPFGLKDSYVFWLSEDKLRVSVFDSKHKTYQTKDVPEFDIKKGERGEVYFDDVSWKVIIGASDFYFWKEETGEVFSDEDGGAIEAFNKVFRLDEILTPEEKESVGIPVENEEIVVQ